MNLLLPLFVSVSTFAATARDTHVWQKVELALHAANHYANPYTNVEVWVDLHGPQFDKRCYGFWDGGAVFRVRVLATRPGQWTWQSGSNQRDAGLNDQTGSFTAVAWSEAEKTSFPTRRGFLQPTANGHTFEHADGTPFLLLGDTWYAAATHRFKWNDDDRERPIGPDAGFKDYLRLRKNQGFNSVAIIAAFPNWADDWQPWEIWLNRNADLGVRSAWVDQGEIANHRPRERWSAKDMSNEGGRAFLFPGKIPGYEQVYPDVDRINPEYFNFLDRKIDYLNAQGFIPIIEVARRDMASCWAKYYDWPGSYSRYIQYVWSRYQELVPDVNLVSPNSTAQTKGYLGWAYCARTPAKDFFLVYFEKNCPQHSLIRGALPNTSYQSEWFDPRTGEWSKASSGVLKANVWGWVTVPDFPADNDWGLKLASSR